jgi:tellurite resistance protein TerB
LQIKDKDMFNWLKQNAEQARSKLTAEAAKFKNRSFMEAVVSGCALVAAADGNIDASEKQKMAGFIERADELKHFDMRQVIEVFKKAAGDFEFDYEIGKATALKAISKIKGNDEQARLLVRVVCAIGAADGDFDAQEKAIVVEIARELGLDPKDFDL